MTKQIKIEELIPFMNEGWVAMNKLYKYINLGGNWCWFKEKPKIDKWNGAWEKSWLGVDLSLVFNIAPAEDWQHSLIKVGDK